MSNSNKMAAEKKNEFLDAGESDDDVGRASDSEDDLRKGGRSAKRRRVDNYESDAEDFSDGGDEDGNDGGASAGGETTGSGEEEAGEGSKQRKKSGETKSESTKDELPGVTKPLTKKNLVATDAAIKKSGVVYISRIPPFMNPAKLRSLLEPYGQINRLFLAPEDPSSRSRRIKGGGNKKRSFTEGWVEFVRKKDAKKACELLNVRPKRNHIPEK